MRQTFLATMVLGMCFLVSGCGGGGSNVPKAAISGTVMLDGKPLAGADVNFVCDEYDFASYGKTDSQGHYTLAQGAAIGQNKVFFSMPKKGEGYNEDPEEGLDDGQFEAANFATDPGGEGDPAEKKDLIPEEFGPEKSKLTYNVTSSGASDADFNLTSSE